MTDMIVAAIVIVIIGAAVVYLYKAKKRGVKCIGCSAGSSGCCCSQEGSDCGCGRGCDCESKHSDQ